MENRLISVIIPVYKAESYIRRCLDSIVNQKYKNFEVILVNDGSPDHSTDIIMEYVNRDSRFKLINKENEGVALARQTGLDNARGEYIIHADPDDTTDPEWLFSLYEKAIEDDSDMVICDYYRVLKNKRVKYSYHPISLDPEQVIIDILESRLWGVTWNKLIRKSVLDKYNIKFHPQTSFCEDLYVNCKLLINHIKVSHVDKALYYYDSYSNSNGIVMNRKIEHVYSLMFIIDELEKILIDPKFKNGLLQQKIKVKQMILHIMPDNPKLLIDTYNDINPYLIERGYKAHFWNLEKKAIMMALLGHERLAKFLISIKQYL